MPSMETSLAAGCCGAVMLGGRKGGIGGSGLLRGRRPRTVKATLGTAAQDMRTEAMRGALPCRAAGEAAADQEPRALRRPPASQRGVDSSTAVSATSPCDVCATMAPRSSGTAKGLRRLTENPAMSDVMAASPSSQSPTSATAVRSGTSTGPPAPLPEAAVQVVQTSSNSSACNSGVAQPLAPADPLEEGRERYSKESSSSLWRAAASRASVSSSRLSATLALPTDLPSAVSPGVLYAAGRGGARVARQTAGSLRPSSRQLQRMARCSVKRRKSGHCGQGPGCRGSASAAPLLSRS
mmetsp:Transcript_20756/g.57471  ORF Transcript_20756/g.57471 Transcript_20756/m.57471 type:complete len:296 (-) Transcript_20756:320-1207(-)